MSAKKSLTSASGATSTSDRTGPDVSGTHSDVGDAKLSDEEGRPSVFEPGIGRDPPVCLSSSRKG